jgi:uncharacterized membrane protein
MTTEPNRDFARSLTSLLIAMVLLFLSMGLGIAGCDRVAGWLSIAMWIALIRGVWIGLGVRND